MRSSVSSFAACLGLLAATTPAAARLPCGSERVPERLLEWHRNAATLSKRLDSGDGAPKRTLKTVPTYVHIMVDPTDYWGNVTDQDIVMQMNILNDAYNATGFSFDFQAPASRVNNTWWANGHDSDRMRLMLHKGDSQSMNVYILTRPFVVINDAIEDVGGFATFPSDKMMDDDDEWPAQDGCIVDSSSLQRTMEDQPAWRRQYSPQGKTLVHEAGHWLGLMHPFDGGCEGDNDLVDDTPPCLKPDSSVYRIGTCDEGRRSCGNDSAPAPVHNYMYYNDDFCRTEFTPGQVDRMHRIWDEFRVPAVPGPAAELTPIVPVQIPGKPLPYYPPPTNNPVRFRLLCEADEQGHIAELREEYCGSIAFCGKAYWTHGAGGTKYAGFGECINDRTNMG